MFSSPNSRTIISGDVCTIRIFITSLNKEIDDDLYFMFNEKIQYKLKSEVEDILKKILGDQFEVRRLTVVRGSVEVLILIGTTYYAVSRYKNFIESINLLTSQIKSLFSKIASQNQPSTSIEVTGDWSPSPALINAEVASSRVTSNPILLIMLLYIILSHAAMLTVIIYQFLQK